MSSNLKELGIALRAYRVAAGESIEQLAQAVELEKEILSKLEAGLHKPNTSDIELIARHFTLRENEVKRLLELAGVESDSFSINLDEDDFDIEKLTKDVEVLFGPIFYTDMVNVATNEYGITINFVQTGSGSEKPVVVSRVGMSHAHAESIIEVLQESVRRAKEKMDEKAADQSSESAE